MGTRADFYCGKNESAEWLGSIAWDGYREGIPEAILAAASEKAYRQAVTDFLADRDDATLPARGWPWPWDDSATTDYSYWFFDGAVFDETGGAYAPVAVPIDSDEAYAAASQGEKIAFPDMSGRKNVRLDKGSGVILVTA